MSLYCAGLNRMLPATASASTEEKSLTLLKPAPKAAVIVAVIQLVLVLLGFVG